MSYNEMLSEKEMFEYSDQTLQREYRVTELVHTWFGKYCEAQSQREQISG
jgi:hypothetical protein